MNPASGTIFVAGANGQLGRLVLASLLKKVPAQAVVAGASSAESAQKLAGFGVAVRQANYEDPAGLERAFAGVEKLLLISSNHVGQRFSQHKNAIDAAKKAGVKLVAYTSILGAPTSPLGVLKGEHLQTEEYLKASGLPHVLLRNGWYTENRLGSVASALEHGTLFGSAGEGRISSATRRDFADAAVAVLTAPENQAGKVYELAGDEAYTLAQWAAELSRQSGKPVVYQDLSEADYKALLLKMGLPEPFAALLADSDTGTKKGGLFNDSRTLSSLIGRPTTPLSVSMKEALEGK